METTIKGKVYVLKDNIDTDQIIPAMHLVYKLNDEEESKNYGKFALSGVPKEDLPEGKPFIEEGKFDSEFTVLIAGKNFGCGSSREHAPFALQKAGVKAIVAEDYARIFYRNSVDGGFLVPFETPERLITKAKTGDEVEIDIEKCLLTFTATGEKIQLNSLGDVKDIVAAGGIFKYARKNNLVPGM